MAQPGFPVQQGTRQNVFWMKIKRHNDSFCTCKGMSRIFMYLKSYSLQFSTDVGEKTLYG